MSAPEFVLAQISDLHICAPGHLAYGRVDTAAALRACVAQLNALARRPDAVIATGDLVDFGRADEYRHLRDLLAPLAMPVYLMPGNHDDRDTLADAFPEHAYLRQMREMPEIPQAATAGGSASPIPFLQYAVDLGPLRLVALDSLVPRAPEGRLCGTRLAWLDRSLAADTRPTIVALHHPPFATYISHMDEIGMDADSARGLAEVLARHPHVQRVIAGHLHRTITAGLGGRVVTVAPSPAHQIALDLRPGAAPAFVMEPPGFHVHVWSAAGLATHTVPIGEFGGPQSFS